MSIFYCFQENMGQIQILLTGFQFFPVGLHYYEGYWTFNYTYACNMDFSKCGLRSKVENYVFRFVFYIKSFGVLVKDEGLALLP